MVTKKRNIVFYVIGLSIFLFLSIVCATTVGSASMTPLDSIRILFSKVPLIGDFIDAANIKEVYEVIVWKVRLPRILQAALVGGGLAMVGCTFQAIFRNALADPHILGISSGASLGATIATLSGITLNFLGLGVTSIFAFVGAIVTVLLVYRVGTLGGRMLVTNVLLTGTAISTLLSAMISLIMIYHKEQIEKVYLWTLGSFSAANWYKVGFLAIISVICIVGLLVFAKDLNVLLTGDEVANSLGIDTNKLKKILILFAALLIAASVSVSGAIGFVGLIIPHCMRLLVGHDHKILLPTTYLLGATFMVICDTIARTIAAPTEIPVGVITALFGAPYFIYLLYRRMKESEV